MIPKIICIGNRVNTDWIKFPFDWKNLCIKVEVYLYWLSELTQIDIFFRHSSNTFRNIQYGYASSYINHESPTLWNAFIHWTTAIVPFTTQKHTSRILRYSDSHELHLRNYIKYTEMKCMLNEYNHEYTNYHIQ